MEIKSQNSECSIDYPISKDKMENCYTPNGETYPLCKGKVGMDLCKECNLYENMIEPYDFV